MTTCEPLNPPSPQPPAAAVLNGFPSLRDEHGERTISLPLALGSERRVVDLVMSRDAAVQLRGQIAKALDDPKRRGPSSTVLATGTVEGEQREASLVLPRVTAELLVARLDYLATKSDVRAQMGMVDRWD